MSTSARLLQMISLFQHRRRWTGPQLSERLGVSERTIRRDVERLRQLGYAIDADRGVVGGYQLGSGATLPPLLISTDEAVALAVGLHASAHAASSAVAEPSVSALAKVVAMLPVELRRRAETVGQVTSAATPSSRGVTPSAEVLGVVAEACRDGVRVEFTYHAPSGEPALRYVEPYRLVTAGQRWYLVAFDADRDDWRTFRVDRIHQPRLARTPFARRQLPAEDLAAYVAERLRGVWTAHEVELLIDAPLADVRAAVGPWVDLFDDHGQTRAVLMVDRLEWAVMVIGALDAQVIVVHPPELVEQLHTVARRLAAVARPSTPRSGRRASAAADR